MGLHGLWKDKGGKGMFPRICVGVIIFLLGLIGSIRAAEVIYVVNGETYSLDCYEIPLQVSVANPKILDISVDGKEVLLTGKNPGRTNVIIVGQHGEKVKYEVIVWEEDLESLYKKLEKILLAIGLKDKLDITVDKENGLLILSGTVFSRDEMDKIEQAVAALDTKLLVNLVHMADVKDSIRLSLNVLEVGTDLNQGLGISWPQELRLTAIGQDIEDESGNGLPFSRGAIRFNIWERNDLSILIRALETNHKGKVLARPNIMATNGKSAKIVVGGEIPIVTYEDNSANVEYRPYGVILNMLPRLIRNGLELKIKCEVSDIDPVHSTTVNVATDTTNAVFSVPAFLSRRAETVVTLKDGQTVVIGGLLQKKRGESRSMLFGLSKLPIIGEFFKSRDISSSESELVITITPEIVKLVPYRKKITSSRSSKVEESVKEKTVSSQKVFSERSTEEIIRSYVKPILDRIRKKVKECPTLHAKGKVLVSIKVSKDGKVENIIIKKSTGDKRLERIALNIIRDIQPLPPLPKGSNLETIWLDLPFVFQ